MFPSLHRAAGALTLALGAVALAAPVTPALAAYPDHTLQLIVPYAPGGTTDIMARIVAPKLGEVLGQTVVVVNKPGAGGALGSAFAAREPADGYTLVMAVESSHAVNPAVHEKSSYDPVKDFAPISNLANVLGVLDVRGDSDIKTFQQLVDQLKAKPGRDAFGSSGSGGYSHLFGELFLSSTGTKMLHVPYKGLGPALVDLMAGQVQVVFDNLPSSAGFIASGKLRALAVASPQRVKTLPDVPTYAELGYPQLNTPSWFGLAAPKNTPAPILDKLNAAIKQVLAEPAVITAIEQQGAVPDYTTREQFAAVIQHSYAVWQKVVNDIGFQKL
ncbi:MULTISPECIES: tripartite tricarboxylate transporter substrate binding protein [unclassified Achromobacter]|uniref:Bug family tripartite tricarboxylate transporter substrate binding protein n=1 Tax=unclassified Achromobacter TaxID=2626865 RepID=UPI000B518D39|nr:MULTISPECIES: tripartite tricarboxylate transporter substrate binding protein [unclassified Achromobacter]OWT80154.1 ABC transporter substrate-binding protein [Achromobacter sp. HZ34]OWT82037.1 ABC transporter substrate-binding protein [Achromobacter sp. HZ28]